LQKASCCTRGSAYERIRTVRAEDLSCPVWADRLSARARILALSTFACNNASASFGTRVFRRTGQSIARLKRFLQGRIAGSEIIRRQMRARCVCSILVRNQITPTWLPHLSGSLCVSATTPSSAMSAGKRIPELAPRVCPPPIPAVIHANTPSPVRRSSFCKLARTSPGIPHVSPRSSLAYVNVIMLHYRSGNSWRGGGRYQ
jgi:hypothetical protein